MIGIDDALAAVSNLADTIIKRVWPDATEAQKAELALISQELQNELAVRLGQLDINKAEAQHPSIWVAGARPAVMWICAGALAYSSIIEPLARFIAVVMLGYVGGFPVLDNDILEMVLVGLLGLGGYRSFEKSRGIDTKRIKP